MIALAIDILEKVLSEEMAFLKPQKDPLEDHLVDTLEDDVVECPNDEIIIYAKLLNSASTYMSSRKHEERFCPRISRLRMTRRVPLK